ncbi:molybdate ABC transporter substrate-binding protein [uncultured Paracoccus sp.]|uniref:molybdate ABC transporter substrate-binding protein n=1 Tax=uncultured Paracoccus sp. TaxID=189685 RepID=UPI00260E49C2|nr:molybdate ABC transporter substrate-binding protein [uncultured Paracoccus sp.]
MAYRFRSAVLPLPLALSISIVGSPADADQVTVFAASSLKTALDRVADAWQAQSGHTVAVSYAGSPQLARQIQQGAPADIFISAAPEWMDELADTGLIEADSRVHLLGNDLVLIAPVAEAATLPSEQAITDVEFSGLLDGGMMAMALVAAVPAGVYGKQALSSLGLWDDVADDVAQGDSARAALALVASGEAPLGIVFGSDALAEPRVAVVATFPAASHDPIIYPAALVATSADRPVARDFMAALQDEDARKIFAEEGFDPLPRH